MAKRKSFPIGDTVKLIAKFYVDRVLTNPSSAVLTIEDPNGTQTTPSVSSDSTGVRSATVVVETAGFYRYKWEGTGSAAGVAEGSFYVSSSQMSS